jgi:hypothetical protein
MPPGKYKVTGVSRETMPTRSAFDATTMYESDKVRVRLERAEREAG